VRRAASRQAELDGVPGGGNRDGALILGRRNAERHRTAACRSTLDANARRKDLPILSVLPYHANDSSDI